MFFLKYAFFLLFVSEDFQVRWSVDLSEYVCVPSGSLKASCAGCAAIPLNDDFDACPFKQNKSIAIAEFHRNYMVSIVLRIFFLVSQNFVIKRR